MKEAVTKVIDTLTQKDFDEALQKLLEQYKWIAARGDYFEGDSSFMRVLSLNMPIRKKVWKIIVRTSYLFYAWNRRNGLEVYFTHLRSLITAASTWNVLNALFF